MLRFVSALGLALVLSSASAQAHPHVWIDMRSTVNFDAGGNITGVRISWTFDEFYSLAAVDGLDANKNGTYEPAEIQSLAAEYTTNLKEHRYFTAIEVGGKAAATAQVTAPGVSFDKGLLTYAFTLPLATAADPRKGRISFSSFDPSYYIDISPAKANAVAFAGGAPKNCGFATRRVENTQPMALNLSSSLKASPPADGIFGAVFTNIVDITCVAGSIP